MKEEISQNREASCTASAMGVKKKRIKGEREESKEGSKREVRKGDKGENSMVQKMG